MKIVIILALKSKSKLWLFNHKRIDFSASKFWIFITLQPPKGGVAFFSLAHGRVSAKTKEID